MSQHDNIAGQRPSGYLEMPPPSRRARLLALAAVSLATIAEGIALGRVFLGRPGAWRDFATPLLIIASVGWLLLPREGGAAWMRWMRTRQRMLTTLLTTVLGLVVLATLLFGGGTRDALR